jgi:hypothetical protein
VQHDKKALTMAMKNQEPIIIETPRQAAASLAIIADKLGIPNEAAFLNGIADQLKALPDSDIKNANALLKNIRLPEELSEEGNVHADAVDRYKMRLLSEVKKLTPRSAEYLNFTIDPRAL